MKNWRFVGFDDGFSGFDDAKAYLVGCITAGTYVEGFLFTRIEVDGLDVTPKIISLISKSKFKTQLQCVFLSGITFGGFNVADINEIFEKTSIPVVVVMRKMPDFNAINNALQRVKDSEKRREVLKKAGKIHEVEGLHLQIAGCSLNDAENFIKNSTAKGKIPEALRISHLVASSLVYGESRKG